MRTPLLTKFQKSSQVGRFLTSMFAIGLLFISFQNRAYSQVDCNITMACNDLVQVSLDENCQAIILPDMLLEDAIYPDDEYTVTVTDPSGHVLPNATVTGAYIGMTLSVSVTLNDCNLSCWGNISIEDKLAPVVVKCPEVILPCNSSTNPGTNVPYPTVDENCSSVDFDYSDEVTNLPCSSPYTRHIVRSWIMTDESGNFTTCDQDIYIQRATIDAVVFPLNYDDVEKPAFSCDVNLELLPNGAPSPNVTGYPTNTSCANIMVFYTDITFDLCGASFKVLRQWNVLDWCTGEERIDLQIIKIIDDLPPVCTSVPDFYNNIPTDEHECTGTFLVPPPTVIFECSEWTYKVGYKLRDENGDPFEFPIYDKVTGNATIGYTIHDLPQDTSWIVYTVTDACGNFSQCFTEVFVSDQEAPSAVCEGYTVITLGDDGWADLFAESIDDHSEDNCEIDRFEVKRLTTNCGILEDLEFGESVNFCCEDVSTDPNKYVKVVMRVYDKAGNYNDCQVNVKVQDKAKPTITCPGNVILDCGQDYKDLTLTGGYATASDNCSVEVTYSYSGSLNDCGQGTIFINWLATDKQGLFATCQQKVTVRDNDPFSEGDITWPDNKVVDGCTVEDALPEIINSYPTYGNTNCANIAMSYDDQVLYGINGLCMKILRTWKIVDWCNYTPGTTEFFTHVQTIELNNSQAPVINSSCKNVTIESNDGTCQAEVDFSVSATDDCTPSVSLKYNWAVDVNNDGTVDNSGAGSHVVGSYPTGTHKVTFTVKDACNNASVCTFLFTIKDSKAPTPICRSEVVWVLDDQGEAEVWASDFDLKSVDSCDEDADLRFAFNAAGNQTFLAFDCSDIPNGVSVEIPLQMWVFDTDGNSDFCEVTLILQDSETNNACPDTAPQDLRIAGNMARENDDNLANVNVTLRDLTDNEVFYTTSDTEGNYEFNNIVGGHDYTVTPNSDAEVMNGVSTLDIVLIQRYILGLQDFDSPYKLLAADVNRTKSITASDLIELRKLILGLIPKFNNQDSWAFVPKYSEVNDNMIFDMERMLAYPAISVGTDHADFMAVKIGDVNESAVTNARNAKDDTRSSLNVYVDNVQLRTLETSYIPVYAGFSGEIYGMQFDLTTPEGLMIKGVQASLLKVDESQFNFNLNGVRASIDISTGEQVKEGDVLFYLEVQSNTYTDLSELTINSKTLSAECYDNELKAHKITFDVRQGVSVPVSSEDLFAVKAAPNPFSNETEVNFTLSKNENVSVNIYDMSGKLVYNRNIEYVSGNHALKISSTDLADIPGVYYLKIKSGHQEETLKMIMIK